MRWTMLIVVLGLLPATTRAQATAESCAASFPARLDDARQAVIQFRQFTQGYSRSMPWFNEHCRLLEDAERIARHEDDPFAFVCDTRRGRPRELTTRYVAQYAGAIPTIAVLIHSSAETRACVPFDGRDRIPLLPESIENSVTMQLLVLCWGRDDNANCEGSRTQLDALVAAFRERFPPPEPEGAEE